MATYNAVTMNPIQHGHDNYPFNLVNPTADMPLYQQLQAWSVQAGHGVPRWDIPNQPSKMKGQEVWIATPICAVFLHFQTMYVHVSDYTVEGVRYARYTKNGNSITAAKIAAARFMIQEIIINGP
jgi:hypothetical protein